jgi:DNA replication initiation complex subunit (GINS family)
LKTYETYQAELETLKQLLNGSIFYLAIPAVFFADAKAKTDDAAYFLMVTPKGIKKITQEKWDEVKVKPDTETYSMPGLSAKTERLYFENTATYMAERRWHAIANAAKNHTLPEKMNAEDQRLYEYLQKLLKNERSEFIATVDARRKANAELKRKYEELQARREAMQNVGKRNGKAASDRIQPPADESPEERVARISSMIAADFGDDDFTPFW